MARQDIARELPIRRRGRKFSGRQFLIIAAVILVAAVAVAFLLSGEREPGQTRLDVTIKELEEAVLNDPQNPDARTAMANAYVARGLYVNAITQYQEALGLRPDDQPALIGLGTAYLRAGDMDSALVPFLRVVELNKDNPRRHTLDQLQAVYYNMGFIYFEKGNLDEAANALQEALTINRTEADSWYLFGQVLERSEKWEEAAKAYSTAVRFVPDFVEAYRGLEQVYGRMGLKGEQAYARGMVRLAEKSPNDAVKELRQAVSLSPQLAVAYEGLGMAYETVGQKAEALESYRQANVLNPELLLAKLGLQRLEGR